MLNYYQTLGVSSKDSLEDIKKSYKKLAFIYHPDRNGGSSEKFLEIQEAYQYLSKNHISTKFKKDSSVSSMFSEIFKSMKKEPIRTHVIRLNVSFREAFEGVTKNLNIKFDIPCTQCNFVTRDLCKGCGGVGYIKEETKDTFIFNNIKHQNQVYTYKNYFKNINLQIKLNILPENNFSLIKNNVYTELPLNIFKAIIGGDFQVKTPVGDIIVDLGGGKIKDYFIRIKGKGLQNQDLIIKFKIELPKELSEEQKEILKKLL